MKVYISLDNLICRVATEQETLKDNFD